MVMENELRFYFYKLLPLFVSLPTTQIKFTLVGINLMFIDIKTTSIIERRNVDKHNIVLSDLFCLRKSFRYYNNEHFACSYQTFLVVPTNYPL